MATKKLSSAVTNLIGKVFKGEYEILKIESTEKGQGHLGEVLMITIKNTQTNNEINFAVKIALSDQRLRAVLPIKEAYQNESYFFTYILPQYLKLEKNCGMNYIKQILPQCFETSNQEPEEILMFDNLKSLGFDVIKQPLNHEHFCLIFETYGRLHAYSYALRHQYPQEFSKIAENLQNVYMGFFKTSFFSDHLKSDYKSVEKSLIPGEDDEILEKYRNYHGENAPEIFKKVVTEVDQDSVILHGDCWCGNFMFKYQETKAAEIKLIDFQMVKLGNPVCDLSYCFYASASKDCLDNLDNYLQIYYKSLTTFLRELKGDSLKLLSFAKLKEHWKMYAKFGMLMAVSTIKLQFVKKEHVLSLSEAIEDLNKAREVVTGQLDTVGYNKRIRSLLQHMYDVDAL